MASESLQQNFWNHWNSANREQAVDEVSRRQAEIVCGWLVSSGRMDLNILEVGCGTGWLCPLLTRFGSVTATDLADEVLIRAQQRMPEVAFVSGNFMELDFGTNHFDVIVALEVLSHVADQKEFIRRLASHLHGSGHLMIATQNRPVLQHLNFIPPPAPGQLRRWVDKRELRNLIEPEFEMLELLSVTPKIGVGAKRLIKAKGLGWTVQALTGNRTKKPRDKAPAEISLATRPGSWVVDGLEAMGLGWTLMALARKRVSA
jgi:2-polyprenyl-3-methyl-5-hydroxy-6-metoxy-1,4-benzoquinol methylase